MWCSTCQQETPGVVNAASRRIVCSRCHNPVQKGKLPHNTRICDEGLALDELTLVAAGSTTKAAPLRTDDWAARERVRTVIRELRRPNPTISDLTHHASIDRFRFDPPHDLFGQIEQATLPSLAAPVALPVTNATLQNQRSSSSQIVAWLIVLAGLLTLGCGVGLIAWSLLHNQMRHWNLAMGLAISGQGVLILGLVLVISRLWRSSRYAAAKLQEVHATVGQVQRASESLVAARGSSAPAFYADLARGASPHILLANLKGQVDQLATRVGSVQ
jgi:hypothetical protein